MNKNKIVCIGVTIILIVVSIVCLGKVLFNNTQNFIENTIAEETSTNEVLEENIVVGSENIEENISNIEQTEGVESVTQVTDTENNTTEVVQSASTKASNTKEKTQVVTQPEVQPQQEQAQQQQEQVQPQETLIQACPEIQVEAVAQVQFTTPKENLPSQTNSNNNSVVSEEKPKNTAQENTYVYNAQMTQQLVDIINNNPSEFMKTYGYIVNIDSSITSLTNQFTFFENRVIEKIQNKAGNIRVYAQDYYYYGEYLFTECYII